MPKCSTRPRTPRAKQKASQARKIIDRFGGGRALRLAIQAYDPDSKLNESTIYRWCREKPHGTGGVIPTHMWKPLLAAARLSGVYITPEDFTEGLI